MQDDKKNGLLSIQGDRKVGEKDTNSKKIIRSCLKRPNIEFILANKTQSLPQLFHLQSNKIILSSLPNKVNNETIVKGILKILAIHKWKTNESLEIKCGKLTDKGAKILASDIVKYSKNLSYLALDFSDCQITYRALDALGIILAKQLLSIRRLNVILSCCFMLADKGAKALSQAYANGLSNLQHLALGFSFCKITDKGIRCLGSTLVRHHPDLKLLTLYFFHCNEISDNGLEFFRSVSSLFKLQHLDLDFSHCQITDKGIQGLVRNITTHMVELRQLTLRCIWCPKITDKGIEDLLSIIAKQSSKLQEVSLNFFPVKISETSQKDLKTLLHWIPNISIS